MAFGLRYWAELQSRFKGVVWRVEIAERGGNSGSSGNAGTGSSATATADTGTASTAGSGTSSSIANEIGNSGGSGITNGTGNTATSGTATLASEELRFDGSDPLKITWERRGDEFFVPVKASEATINILCTENFRYIGLFTSDPRRYRVSVFRNGALFWRGYVVADLYSENFAAPPYQVSIKAVDGFNLLQSIPFRNPDGTQLTGRRSLWSLVEMCIEVLELDLDVADWMDLYAEGMNESLSPMRQVYVDMERFYRVYEEPTYRDVLELCLRPFAGQIFQSNGSLHIRRAVSLYRETRPVSFYEIGNRYTSGVLVSHTGQQIVLASGDYLVTEATRERIESMWQGGDERNRGGLDIMGESTMDIVPPLRKVSVTIKNKGMDNLIPVFRFYELSEWYDPYEFLSLKSATTLQFMGDGDHQNHIIQTYGTHVEKCTYKLTLEYAIRAQHVKYGSSYRTTGDNEYKFNFYYGVKVVGASQTYWLQDDGQWVAYEGFMMVEAKTSTEESKKIEIEGIPVSGQLVFMIKQTLKYSVSTSNRTRYGEWEGVTISNMSLTMDTGEDYANSLTSEIMVNHANNADMDISLPIADIPNIPNDRLIYALYFTNSAGSPTRMWRTRGGNDYNTLVNHLVGCALTYRQLPSRRISGEMFSGKHIDMNTVVQDSKFLFAGFHANSIELSALDDGHDIELVEMPGLIQTETPPQGDDCILCARLSFSVKTAVLCGSIIVLLSTDNRIYAYDPAAKTVRQLLSYATSATVDIYPADNSFCVVDGGGVSVIDYRGVTLKRYDKAGFDDPATYMGGYIYLLLEATNRDRNTNEVVSAGYYYLNRPEYVYVSTGYVRGVGYDRTSLTGTVTSILKAHSAIAINTTSGAWLHDVRVNHEMTATASPSGAEIVSLSDYFIVENQASMLRIYRRDTFSERMLVKSISGKATFADHTLGEVAYCTGSTLYIWTYLTNTIRQLRNTAGASRPLRGLHYINGQLHIVRDNAIYKYIP